MAINNLLNGFRRAAVRGALLALLAPIGYGCGDTVENNYYGDGENGSSDIIDDVCNHLVYDCPDDDFPQTISECRQIYESAIPILENKYGQAGTSCYLNCLATAPCLGNGMPDYCLDECGLPSN